MKFLVYISDFMIPLVIFMIVGYGILTHCNVYDDFIRGAADGLKTAVGILPTLVALMMAVGILRASGTLGLLADIIRPITNLLHFPSELVSLVIVKMFSSSAATGLLLDVYKEYGTDSYLGTLSSILMSCSDPGVIIRRKLA